MDANEKISRAAQRRVHEKERAAAIADLGWPPEDPSNPYIAKTGELARWAREAKS